MKKTFLVLITIVIIIISFLLSKYYELKDKEQELSKFNLKYEEYFEKDIFGRDVATVINMAKNDNDKFKDETEFINIDIKIIDLINEITFKMETFYEKGIDEFVQYYGSVKFKCTEIKYGNNKRVNYLLFEQIEK